MVFFMFVKNNTSFTLSYLFIKNEFYSLLNKVEKMEMIKAIAGYHMLMILSNVDGEFNPNEGKLIIEFLEKNFPSQTDLDAEVEILSNIKEEDYLNHFTKCMNSFYKHSTFEERSQFVGFAMQIIKADDKITDNENTFINELLNSWEPELV